MTRSSTDPLYTFDPEIELTLRRLRKIRNTTINISSINFVINCDQSRTDHYVASTNIFLEPGQTENHDKTLKELATPNVPAQTYELKSGLIHVVCSTMRPQGIPEDYIKMKAFPFSLDGITKD
ncbi:hypothetical protein CR513_05168, partial [Mucuna pruriens]